MAEWDIAFLGGVVSAFVVFSVALAWVSHEYARNR